MQYFIVKEDSNCIPTTFNPESDEVMLSNFNLKVKILNKLYS